MCQETCLHLHSNDFICRREAASSVLKKSASRQRSYVLSAAKKFEYVSQECVYLEVPVLHSISIFKTDE